MYLMYVDESGDSGLHKSPTSHFALSGLVIHESRWRDFANQMLAFRRTIKAAHGLPIRTEIHASAYIKSEPVPGMARHVRLAILRNLLDELASTDFISITNVIVSKAGKPPDYPVFEMAWQALFQRFENTLRNGNFPGAHRTDYGAIFTDATNGKTLQKMVRKMSVYNPIPHMAWAGQGTRNIPLLRIIEDPHPKNSAQSYFIQACDVSAYFLFQRFAPNGFIKRIGAQRYLDRLAPILNRRASHGNELGIVVL
jgi:hypothetical protein